MKILSRSSLVTKAAIVVIGLSAAAAAGRIAKGQQNVGAPSAPPSLRHGPGAGTPGLRRTEGTRRAPGVDGQGVPDGAPPSWPGWQLIQGGGIRWPPLLVADKRLDESAKLLEQAIRDLAAAAKVQPHILLGAVAKKHDRNDPVGGILARSKLLATMARAQTQRP